MVEFETKCDCHCNTRIVIAILTNKSNKDCEYNSRINQVIFELALTTFEVNHLFEDGCKMWLLPKMLPIKVNHNQMHSDEKWAMRRGSKSVTYFLLLIETMILML